MTITSRGCIRNCDFCFVPKREGKLRELEIKDGWIVQDNNLLACSRKHIEAVFEMLRKQKKAINFSGGLDSKLFKKWHMEQIEGLTIKHLWFSCDYPEAEKYLKRAGELLANYPIWKKRCYVLIGFNGESVVQAEKRLEGIFKMGFLPFAQLYQGEHKKPWTKKWDRLQRKWCRPAAYRSILP